MPTVLHRLARWAQDDPGASAQLYKQRGEWKTITAREFNDRVYYLALFLESRGMKRSEIGCILSGNCPQWVHLDLATMLLGAKSAGLYPNSTSKDILYVLVHCEAKILSVQNAEYFKRIAADPEHAAALDRLSMILTFERDTSFPGKAVSYDEAREEGRVLAGSGSARNREDYLDEVNVDEDAFIIYTSGTSRNPKGALLSHDNLVFTSDLVTRYWNLPLGGDVLFSFLPLCHIAEKLQSIGVGISRRYAVNFCTRFEDLQVELQEVQPTLLFCVPRLWEKMMEGVTNKVLVAKGAERRLAEWALGVGARVAGDDCHGHSRRILDRAQLKLADLLVLSRIRKALGLAQAKHAASGAATLPAHVARWFRCLRVEILEAFGQTESRGIICMTEPGSDSIGTVGNPVPGIEMRIADDSEILTRGRHVFKG